MPCSATIGEPSFYSGWEQIQSPQPDSMQRMREHETLRPK